MTAARLLDAAREQAGRLQTMSSLALRSPGELWPLLQALTVLSSLLASSASHGLAMGAELTMLDRLVRRAGRRLEDHLDGERPRNIALVNKGVIEPDVVPIGDAVAQCLGRGLQPAGDVELAEVVEAIAQATETELGAALVACTGGLGFELPRPWRTPFVPRDQRTSSLPLNAVAALQEAVASSSQPSSSWGAAHERLCVGRRKRHLRTTASLPPLWRTIAGCPRRRARECLVSFLFTTL